MAAKSMFLNSNPYSNYRPLPDQNMMAMLTGQQNPNVLKDGGQNQQQHSRLSSMGGSSAHSLGPQTPQIYRQTKEQAAEANQMTGIPNTHYRGQLPGRHPGGATQGRVATDLPALLAHSTSTQPRAPTRSGRSPESNLQGRDHAPRPQHDVSGVSRRGRPGHSHGLPNQGKTTAESASSLPAAETRHPAPLAAILARRLCRRAVQRRPPDTRTEEPKCPLAVPTPSPPTP